MISSEQMTSNSYELNINILRIIFPFSHFPSKTLQLCMSSVAICDVNISLHLLCQLRWHAQGVITMCRHYSEMHPA